MIWVHDEPGSAPITHVGSLHTAAVLEYDQLFSQEKFHLATSPFTTIVQIKNPYRKQVEMTVNGSSSLGELAGLCKDFMLLWKGKKVGAEDPTPVTRYMELGAIRKLSRNN